MSGLRGCQTTYDLGSWEARSEEDLKIGGRNNLVPSISCKNATLVIAAAKNMEK